MTGLGQSILEEGIAMGETQGKVLGKAESILDLLADIGTVSSELARQIYARHDERELRRWLKLAAKAGNIEQFVESM